MASRVAAVSQYTLLGNMSVCLLYVWVTCSLCWSLVLWYINGVSTVSLIPYSQTFCSQFKSFAFQETSAYLWVYHPIPVRWEARTKLTLGAEAWSGPIRRIEAASFLANPVLFSSCLQCGKFLVREGLKSVWDPWTWCCHGNKWLHQLANTYRSVICNAYYSPLAWY